MLFQFLYSNIRRPQGHGWVSFKNITPFENLLTDYSPYFQHVKFKFIT